MIQLHNVALDRDQQTLLKNVSLSIFGKQKIGLVGANGSGKSSFFAAILGELEVSAGSIEKQNKLRIAHLQQETPALAISAIDYVLQGDLELQAIEEQLVIAEQTNDMEMIMRLHMRMADIDGYAAPARAAKILAGLGFSAISQQQAVKTFSGGWRMRLNLARCLMCPADLLLLDEPTNHLDLDAIIWLEKWLKHYPGTLLLISHDRDFLDGVVTHIIHIEHNNMKIYSGDYSAFEEQRARAIALQNATHKKQQAKIAHMMKFVNRFRVKATKAKQAQSRLKAISRLEITAAAQEDSAFYFEFLTPEQQPNPLIKLDHVNVGYEQQSVLSNINQSLFHGARIGLLGPNGAGKSTFVKTLAGELSVLAGECIVHQATKIGYFAQHQLEQLDLAVSALEHMLKLAPNKKPQELRSFLGGFAFSGDKVLNPVSKFSGGEKARLALALIVWQRPNLLLLDEPTNHLDLDMREALMMALQSYQGTLVVITHDRHLLRSTVNEFWLVADNKVTDFDGDLNDYQRWLSQRKL